MSKDHSPITGIIEESEVLLDFGPYVGKSLGQVSREDPTYYQRLVDQTESGIFSIRRGRDKIFSLYLSPTASLVDH